MRTTALRTLGCSTVAALGLLVVAHVAHAQSGTRLTPDGKRALVSKDIAGQRWAISRNPDGTVTGNVFFPGGGTPQFVFCTQSATTGGDVVLSCSGAGACPLAECRADEWTFVAEVTLPLTFFGAGTGEVASSSSSPTLPKPPFPGVKLTRIAGGAAATASGLQLTPDRALTLISKDVGNERWAISRNDDGTVTGNVFFPGGGEPRFVWCEPNGAAGATVPLRCLGAPACAAGAACSAAEWTLIAEVALPATFFAPRETVTLDELSAAVTASLGEDAGFDALALAMDRGYSLRPIARAALSARLRASGEIVTAAGAVEAPDGPALGLLTVEGAASVLARPLGGRRITAQDVRLAFKKLGVGGGIIALIVGLVDNGYSLGQIVEEVFLLGGDVDLSVEDTLTIRDASGNVIQPAGPPRGIFKVESVSLCNNGQLDPFEDCDGTLFPGNGTCEEIGRGNGTLLCSSTCRLDASRCADGCGNGTIEAPGEECERDNLDGKTCASFNLGPGSLRCDVFCQIDTRGCTPPSCTGGGGAGDDVAQVAGGVCCDPGSKPCGGTCIDAAADCCDGGDGYCNPGTVCVDDGCCPSAFPRSCGDRCIAAGASCCGNGVKESGEECDGADLGGASCEAGGSVRCSGTCSLDRSGCELSCEPPAFECGAGCAPGGADCCGAIGYCAPGKVCAGPGNDACCPADKPEICGDSCVPASNVCCGTYSCSAGDVCAGSTGAPKCCPSVYPVSCGSQCFAPGSVCCGDGACIPGAVCREGLCGPP